MADPTDNDSDKNDKEKKGENENASDVQIEEKIEVQTEEIGGDNNITNDVDLIKIVKMI